MVTVTVVTVVMVVVGMTHDTILGCLTEGVEAFGEGRTVFHGVYTYWKVVDLAADGVKTSFKSICHGWIWWSWIDE